MPLPFPIYMQYPFVMLNAVTIVDSYAPGNTLGSWGVITAVSPTSNFGVGNVVFYKTNDVASLVDYTPVPDYPKPVIQKTLILPADLTVNENNIMFVNA
jgi:hypothetical protein